MSIAAWMKKNVSFVAHHRMAHAATVHLKSTSMVPVPINVFIVAQHQQVHAAPVHMGNMKSRSPNDLLCSILPIKISNPESRLIDEIAG